MKKSCKKFTNLDDFIQKFNFQPFFPGILSKMMEKMTKMTNFPFFMDENAVLDDYIPQNLVYKVVVSHCIYLSVSLVCHERLLEDLMHASFPTCFWLL